MAKTFGLVSITDITAPKNATPGKEAGMMVEFSQSYDDAYVIADAGAAGFGMAQRSGSRDGSRKSMTLDAPNARRNFTPMPAATRHAAQSGGFFEHSVTIAKCDRNTRGI